MTQEELQQRFAELSSKADSFHEETKTSLTLTSVELVSMEQQKRKELSIHIREHVYNLEKEIERLEDMKKILRIKQSWLSSDWSALDSYKYELIQDRREQRL